MKISIAKPDVDNEKVEVSIVRTVEMTERVTPEKLKEKRAYLMANITKWQAEIVKVDELLRQIYEEIQNSKN